MGFGRILTTGLKGKLVLAVLVGTAVVGGTTAAMAATPTGQTFVNQITHNESLVSFTAPDNMSRSLPNKETANPGATIKNKICSTPAELKQLISKYSPSNASNSAAVKAICSLNNGTFTGKTTKGVLVKSNQPYSYTEIAQLLAYAQQLAAQNKTKLTDSNITTYLADVLQSLGHKLPGFHAGPNKGIPVKGTPGAWPTGTPGAWPTGTPGAWPTGTPGAWPTGTPGAWPMGTPGAWPTGTPGAWPTGTPVVKP